MSACIACSYKFEGSGFRILASNFECNFNVFVVYEVNTNERTLEICFSFSIELLKYCT